VSCGKDFVNPELVPGMSPEVLEEIREAAQMANNGEVKPEEIET